MAELCEAILAKANADATKIIEETRAAAKQVSERENQRAVQQANLDHAELVFRRQQNLLKEEATTRVEFENADAAQSAFASAWTSFAGGRGVRIFSRASTAATRRLCR